MKKIAVQILKIYHNYLSPIMLPCCRFHPSCSQYAIDAIEKHGLLFGILRSMRRVLRCNPLSKGGYDPV